MGGREEEDEVVRTRIKREKRGGRGRVGEQWNEVARLEMERIGERERGKGKEGKR